MQIFDILKNCMHKFKVVFSTYYTIAMERILDSTSNSEPYSFYSCWAIRYICMYVKRNQLIQRSFNSVHISNRGSFSGACRILCTKKKRFALSLVSNRYRVFVENYFGKKWLVVDGIDIPIYIIFWTFSKKKYANLLNFTSFLSVAIVWN